MTRKLSRRPGQSASPPKSRTSKAAGSRQQPAVPSGQVVVLPSGHPYRLVDRRMVDGVSFLRLEAVEPGHKPRKLIVPLSQALRLFFPKK